nr:MAG TPA: RECOMBINATION ENDONUCLEASE VII [Caudoviricetes sp.]
MARTIEEWIGKTDDTRPSKACQRRILERQGYVCALTGLPFDDKNKPRFDHKVALWLGGENREKNLQALREDEAHKPKTKAEAKVRAKVHAVIDKRFGLGKPKHKIPSRPKPAPKSPRIDKAALPPLPLPPLMRLARS